MANMRLGAAMGAIVFVGGIAWGCGLRQNLRNEFLSFRGAWFCAAKDCANKDMKRSTKGAEEGGVRVSYGTMQPRAALVFNAGAQVETFSATVTDCKGKSMAVPDGDLHKPGQHAIAGESDSWVVVLDKGALGELSLDAKGKCSKLVVTARATWPKGTSYEDQGGIKAP